MTLLLRDERASNGRTTGGKGGVFFRPAWKFPPGVESFIERVLAECPRPVLHVCSGSSRLGDVRVDIVHPAADIRADARHLPFADGVFGTVVMDPPYRLPGNDLVERQAFVQEAGRVVRAGGVFLLHAPWMPAPTWADLEDVWVRDQNAHRLPGPAVLLTKWRVAGDRARREIRDLEVARPEAPLVAQDADRSAAQGQVAVGQAFGADSPGVLDADAHAGADRLEAAGLPRAHGFGEPAGSALVGGQGAFVGQEEELARAGLPVVHDEVHGSAKVPVADGLDADGGR